MHRVRPQTHSTTDKHYPAGEVKESEEVRLATLARPAERSCEGSRADALAEVDFLKPSEALHALGPTLVIERQQLVPNTRQIMDSGSP
eukprot:s4227_g3.t1